jgi:chemotaxis-related protein WspD
MSESLVAISDCWNKIGVRGDSSCPELKAAIHCRNCRVYSAAAMDLLDTKMPADYQAQCTEQISRAKALAELDTHSAVIFRLGAEWIALATTALQEIASLRSVHAVPHRRDGVLLGLTNIRGELLPCFSLRKVLDLEPAEEFARLNARVSARLLVLVHEGDRAVCPVDEVSGIDRFHPRELTPVPATLAKAAASYTRLVLSWQEKSVALLDEELLFRTVNQSLS